MYYESEFGRSLDTDRHRERRGLETVVERSGDLWIGRDIDKHGQH